MSEPLSNEYLSPRSESMDVVLVKAGVNAVQAKPEDFRRVPVVARDPSAALDDPAVAKALGEGYRLVQATTPNNLTDVEQAARRRQHEAEYGQALDRTKV